MKITSLITLIGSAALLSATGCLDNEIHVDDPTTGPGGGPASSENAGGSTAATTDPPGECGNGVVETLEECDDFNGDNTDYCTNECLKAACGDGYLQPGEECDHGDKNGDGDCREDCTYDACAPQAPTYVGMVTNQEDPKTPGKGIGSVWVYSNQIGTAAGEAMCQAVGATGVCTYAQVKQAEADGEFESLPPGTRFWIHRVTETVFVPETGTLSKPGAGGRCNDWTLPSNHIGDGEWAGVDANGQIHYYFDDDTVYSGVSSDNHQGPGYEGEIGTPGTGHGGNCSSLSSVPKAILCCNSCAVL